MQQSWHLEVTMTRDWCVRLCNWIMNLIVNDSSHRNVDWPWERLWVINDVEKSTKLEFECTYDIDVSVPEFWDCNAQPCLQYLNFGCIEVSHQIQFTQYTKMADFIFIYLVSDCIICPHIFRSRLLWNAKVVIFLWAQNNGNITWRFCVWCEDIKTFV